MKTILPLQLLVAPSKNDPDPLVLYHGRSCPDGFGAALAAWLYYGGQVQCVGLDHGDVQTVADLPPLDLLIRTSGEIRLSNFLLWQSAYAEMLFIDTLWPDFTPEMLSHALDDFAQRERRFGGR